jgi:hypothetical protein
VDFLKSNTVDVLSFSGFRAPSARDGSFLKGRDGF